KCRLHGTADDGIEQRADEAAVNEADRVVGGLVGQAGEADLTRLDLDDAEREVRCDGWGRQRAVSDGAQVFQTGQPGTYRSGSERVVPGDRLRARLAP